MDLNKASREELIGLGGVANEIVDAIIARRPFRSIEQLIEIPGIGRATLQRLIAQGLTVTAAEIPEEVGMTNRQESEDLGAFVRRQRSIEDEVDSVRLYGRLLSSSTEDRFILAPVGAPYVLEGRIEDVVAHRQLDSPDSEIAELVLPRSAEVRRVYITHAEEVSRMAGSYGAWSWGRYAAWKEDPTWGRYAAWKEDPTAWGYAAWKEDPTWGRYAAWKEDPAWGRYAAWKEDPTAWQYAAWKIDPTWGRYAAWKEDPTAWRYAAWKEDPTAWRYAAWKEDPAWGRYAAWKEDPAWGRYAAWKEDPTWGRYAAWKEDPSWSRMGRW